MFGYILLCLASIFSICLLLAIFLASKMVVVKTADVFMPETLVRDGHFSISLAMFGLYYSGPEKKKPTRP